MHTKMIFNGKGWLPKACCILLAALAMVQAHAQVKIGSPGAPHVSAVLHLDGGGQKGLLLPIVNSKEALADIPSPTQGLLVYGAHTKLMYYHNGNGWMELESATGGFSLPHDNIYTQANGAVLRLVNNANNGTAIEGRSNGGKGLVGISNNGTALEATSANGIALQAGSDQGITALLMHGSSTGNALLVPVGRTGLGTNNPQGTLHVETGNVIFRAPATLPGSPAAPPVSGAGNRMMWYADKAAFRAGTVTGTQWDQNNVGIGSIGLGHNASAAGLNAISLGRGTIASGDHGVATGFNSQATGAYSTALGFNTTAQSGMEMVVGSWNTLYTPGSTTGAVATDRLFVVANGTAANNRSNAITVRKNGNVGINLDAPAYRLDVGGDINLTGALRASGNAGTAGQVLTSTGTGLEWASVANPVVARSGSLTQQTLPVISAGQDAFLDYQVITGLLGFEDGSIDYVGKDVGFRVNEAGTYQIMVNLHVVPNPQAEGDLEFEVQKFNFPIPPPNTILIGLDTKYLVAGKNPSVVHLQASKVLKLEPGNTIRVRLRNFSNNTVSVLGGSTSSMSVVKLY